ncbi:hypothetical protein J23TS9_51500 [Paenibacillus sp. J23TS9]|uniref:hypothetical protein n=1 Tax=Paenibacillus sp. J23TS9 TaxID=2807193 RepID=UPI001B23EF6C|nr:hypothetical protein [Paenibacillus sp. J23TS9]GIP30020.1 hypothetical protein J23TS9_51500 [Paenibacillus sp. J23TS9]
MKKRIVLLVTACTMAVLIIAGIRNILAPTAKPAQNTTAIEKTEITTEAMQQETSDIPSMLILNVEDKDVEIQLNSLPELAAYLHEQEDKPGEIARLRTYPVKKTSEENLFVIGYGCGTKLCSGLELVKVTDGRTEGLRMPSGLFINSVTSKDQNKAIFQYGSSEGGMVTRSFIAVVDLRTLSKIPFESSEMESLYSEHPLVPITEVLWTGSRTIKLTVADITATDFASLEQWYASDSQKVKEVLIELRDR